MTVLIDPAQWLSDLTAFRGEWQGGAHGSDICIIADRLEGPGGGPRLHRHPYPEVFIVRRGRGLFTVGDEEILAEAGQILVVPPGVPHKFTNLGPDPFEKISIHERGSSSTEWLE